MQATPIALDLRVLSVALRRQACLGEALPPALCKRLAGALVRLARKVDVVEAEAASVPELEDELLAVAHDPARAPEPVSSGYQAALKAQQLQLQRELDGGGPEPVSRPGLAALAMPIGDSNVMVFPVAPRSRGPFDGDDGLDGGDAA